MKTLSSNSSTKKKKKFLAIALSGEGGVEEERL
jgi:hypothetical protein